jgi:hypothetical protein
MVTAMAAVTLPVPHLRGAQVPLQVLYPRQAGAEASWGAALGTLTGAQAGAVPAGQQPPSHTGAPGSGGYRT